MKVSYSTVYDNITNTLTRKEEAVFLVSNKEGGFFLSGLDSRYSGMFVNLGGTTFKIIDEIRKNSKPNEVKSRLWKMEVKRKDSADSFFMPLHTNSLVYESDKAEQTDLILDIHHPFDNRSWGKNYEVHTDRNRVIIKYTKRYDSKDNDIEEGEEYTLFLVIRGDDNLRTKEVCRWIEKEYSYDKARHSEPSSRYVFHSVSLYANSLVFTVGINKEKAIQEADMVFSNIGRFKNLQQKHTDLVCTLPKSISSRRTPLISDEEEMAYSCASYSLECMSITGNAYPGIYAGLPWLFQYWLSDECISLKGFMHKEDFAYVKKVLLRQLENLAREDYKDNPRMVYSADFLCWHCKRWSDLISMLSTEKRIDTLFTRVEIEEITKVLEKIVKSYLLAHEKVGLLVFSDASTWMYSADRPGARIEMQAMLLNMYSILYKLTGKEEYWESEKAAMKHIRTVFWDGKLLHDAETTDAVRPNPFLAAYIYNGFLTSKEWEKCFDTIIPKLWLPFGGISTLDKVHENFLETHTGEKHHSHHHGDSRYWLNNVAAIVLNRLNKEKYERYVQDILKSSSKEILWKGILGHHAELSSAKSHRSEGCLASAKSAATYIELVHELKR